MLDKNCEDAGVKDVYEVFEIISESGSEDSNISKLIYFTKYTIANTDHILNP